MHIDELATPAALIEDARLARNIARMQSRMDSLGVSFRPHVKTCKCVEVARRQLAAGARGITVSTLKEAEQFFQAGFEDILYAVSLAPQKVAPGSALLLDIGRHLHGQGLRLLGVMAHAGNSYDKRTPAHRRPRASASLQAL